MPTYEYACRECGQHVEVVQSFRDGPLTECGVCGGPLRKVFSAAGIVFKGSGYYVTDSRKPPAESGAGSGDKGSGKAGEDKKAGDGGSAAEKHSGDQRSGDKRSGEKRSDDKRPGDRRPGSKPADRPAAKSA